MKKSLANRLTDFFVNYFTLSSHLVPQSEAEQSIRDDVSFKGTNILILVLAILIASLGLNTNSTAVIIGAMLISPLMGPIIGIGLGVGIHDFELIKRALRNLIMAAGFSVIASTVYFLISPVAEGHSELLARTSPTIYDVLIGFVGGGAGILAIGSRSKGNVIPGVAIATALIPPLCTAGYGLATWQLNYFFGAFYLFIINSIYIAFATFIGVKLLGYKGQYAIDSKRANRVKKIVYALAILTMLPSIWLTISMFRQNKFEMQVGKFVSQECVFPDAQVVSDKAFIYNGQRVISITLIGRSMPLDSLQQALSARLKFYNLQGTQLKIVQGSMSASSSDIELDASDGMKSFYDMAQATIATQERTIDSLKKEISSMVIADGKLISPELKVIFPEVSDISVGRNIFTEIDSLRTDTVNVALVHFGRQVGPERRDLLREYLEARLKLSDIEIVTIPVTHKNESKYK